MSVLNNIDPALYAASNNSSFCRLLAPLSEEFSKDVNNEWGAGGIVFLTIPPVLSLVMIALYCEEVYYVFLKSNSKELRNSLLWILGTYPAVILISTISVFIPRALVYMTFMYTIYVAFAVYKYYYLIIVFAGGTKPFVDKTESHDIRLNNAPCCCLVCIPTINNSMRVTTTTKWLIFQNVIFTPFYGALGMILKSDFKLYSTTEVPAAVYLSIFNSLSTLVCMYGFKTIAIIANSIEGMEKMHAIKGKTICMQLTMFVTGFESLIFNVLAQFDLFPCDPPFDFYSNRKAYNNYAVVIQIFLLGVVARHFYRRKADIQRQAVLTDDETTMTYSRTHGAVASSVTKVLGDNLPSYNGTGVSNSCDVQTPDSASNSNLVLEEDC
ncbi:organic solute transporter subunit alpha [Ciona intestinalis]